MSNYPVEHACPCRACVAMNGLDSDADFRVDDDDEDAECDYGYSMECEYDPACCALAE